jgi:thiamine kinase-like enzyme
MNDENRSAYIGIMEANEKHLVRENKKLRSALDKFISLAEQFIEKVDSGRAHSTETYETFKAILYELEEQQNNNVSGS